MSTTETLALGAIAGFTIFLSLPMARLRNLTPGVGVALNAVATGILIFLFWDVLSHGVEPVETHLEAHNWGPFIGYAALLLVGPGAAAVDEFEKHSWLDSLTPGRRLALLIATGIGLHNFGEGLAIGQSAATGEISLALVLIIGFGLHNATEGFGIIGPMSGESEVPSWRFLGLMGLIGGGPTFVGTVIGQAWVSPALEVVFFAIAAGSILYVVIQLLEVCRRQAMPVLVGWMLLLGLMLGLGTDWVLVAAGA
jgi:ZIP family zinc transporter